MIEEEGGFYKGKIILDGEDIKGLSTEVLRTRIGMVFQQPIAFPYSIEKNLSYVLKYHGIREAGEIERITRECLQKARLYDEIKDQLKKSAKKFIRWTETASCHSKKFVCESGNSAVG